MMLCIRGAYKMETVLVYICIFLSLLLLSFVLACGNNLSMQEDLELERQLKRLNKLAVKTIMSQDGDIYDCVDTYKQPAFDHPLLKNHKLQLKPISYPVEISRENALDNGTVHIGLPDGGCPLGTVPIRRIKKEDLVRMGASPRYMKYVPWTTDLLADGKRLHQLAVLKTGVRNYYGGSAYINVYGLPLTKQQTSASLIWVKNDVDEREVNILSAGWGVNPVLYGDSRTRLTTSWTIDNYMSTGCDDTLCPGFVQVDRQIPLGSTIAPLSTYDGPQYEIYICVYKDPNTGHWWLLVGEDKRTIGYWPSNILTSLSKWANRVDYGGIVAYLPGKEKPPMGSGHFSKEGTNRACFFHSVEYVDDKNQLITLRRKDTYFTVTLSECYDVDDYFYGGTDWGNMFHFGGPGNCY